MSLHSDLDTDFDITNLIRELKEIRVRQGISQREIASEMGVDQGNFNRMENGKYRPKIRTLMIWARALGYKLEFKLEKDPVSLDKAMAELGL